MHWWWQTLLLIDYFNDARHPIYTGFVAAYACYCCFPSSHHKTCWQLDVYKYIWVRILIIFHESLQYVLFYLQSSRNSSACSSGRSSPLLLGPSEKKAYVSTCLKAISVKSVKNAHGNFICFRISSANSDSTIIGTILTCQVSYCCNFTIVEFVLGLKKHGK